MKISNSSKNYMKADENILVVMKKWALQHIIYLFLLTTQAQSVASLKAGLKSRNTQGRKMELFFVILLSIVVQIRSSTSVWYFPPFNHSCLKCIIFCVKVDDLLTEKAWGGVGGEHPKLTISCIGKGKSTFTLTAHTRLLGRIAPSK